MNIILFNLESSPSLSLPVMQEILIQQGHVCKYANIPISGYDEKLFNDLAKQIIAIGNNPDLIGISCMTNTFIICSDLAKHIRKYSDAKIIFGGIHPTVKPLEVLDVADYVCVGEGEEALAELALRLENGERTDNIRNVYTKIDGKIIENELRPLIQNLDDLPVISFNLDNLYRFYQGEILCLAQHQYLLNQMYSDFYFIITSRGCPYRCTYCLNNALINVDKKYAIIRRRSNQHIINELNNFINIYKRQVTIGFVDDDFCAQSEQNLEQFLEIYKKEINLPFFVASTPSSISERKMSMLYANGLARLEIGIQSASDYVNKVIYQRNTSRKKLVEAINIVKPYSKKLQLNFDIILDNPWEDESTKLETLRFLYTLPKPVVFGLFSLCLYPGTDLYYRALKEGKIKDELKEIYRKNHMTDIENDAINTLFILYARFHIPEFMIEHLLLLNKFKPVNKILVYSTYPLWKVPVIFRHYKIYCVVLLKTIQKGDLTSMKYYFKRLFNAL